MQSASQPHVPPRVGALLDLENLVHDTLRSGPGRVRQTLTEVVAVVRGLGEAVTLVGACNPWLAALLVPAAAAAGVRIFWSPLAPNAADHELLRRAEDIAASVDLLVVASGDGIFVDLVAAERDRGREVVVVAREGCVAGSLARAAHRVVVLPPDGEIDLRAA